MSLWCTLPQIILSNVDIVLAHGNIIFEVGMLANKFCVLLLVSYQLFNLLGLEMIQLEQIISCAPALLQRISFLLHPQPNLAELHHAKKLSRLPLQLATLGELKNFANRDFLSVFHSQISSWQALVAPAGVLHEQK